MRQVDRPGTVRRVVVAWAVLAGPALIGCAGEAVGSVTGKVTLGNGSPVTEGTISFIPPSGIPVTTLIQSDGSYRAENVPAGGVLVTVAGPPSMPEDIEHQKVIKEAGGKGLAPPPPARRPT